MVAAAYDIRPNLSLSKASSDNLLILNYLRFGFFTAKYLRTTSPSVAGNGVPQDMQTTSELESDVEFSIV